MGDVVRSESRNELRDPSPTTDGARDTYPLELVELDEHYGLLRVQMPSKVLSHVGDECDHNRKRLGG